MDWTKASDKLPPIDAPCLVRGEPYGSTCYAFAFYDGKDWQMADLSFGWMIASQTPRADPMSDDDDIDAIEAWVVLNPEIEGDAGK